MYLVDSNVWVALSILPHVHHAAVAEWFDSVTKVRSLVICRATQDSFLRLITRTAVLGAYGLSPLTNHQAWATYDNLMSDDRLVFWESEPADLPQRWRSYSDRGTASPKLWMDAYLAAFAAGYGWSFVTTDAGFRQFTDLELILLGS